MAIGFVNKRKIRGGIDLFQSFPSVWDFRTAARYITITEKNIQQITFAARILDARKSRNFQQKRTKMKKSTFSKFEEVTIRDKQSTAGGTGDETVLIEYVEVIYGTSGLDNHGLQRASLVTK